MNEGGAEILFFEKSDIRIQKSILLSIIKLQQQNGQKQKDVSWRGIPSLNPYNLEMEMAPKTLGYKIYVSTTYVHIQMPPPTIMHRTKH